MTLSVTVEQGNVNPVSEFNVHYDSGTGQLTITLPASIEDLEEFIPDDVYGYRYYIKYTVD